MFYFKFYNSMSRLVQKEIDDIPKTASINPNDINLSYVAWKGTIIWRKSMLFNKI
jgi:hypothetical protein